MDEAGSRLAGFALAFALSAHAGQTRKNSDAPTATHLLRVGALALAHGADAEQLAAAFLHDTLEDCEGVSEAGLREAFGPRVAEMVAALTDTLHGDTPGEKSPWAERKQRYIERLRGLDVETRLVAACDKLDNLRSLTTDLSRRGPAALKGFNATPRQTRWYFETVHAALGDDLPRPLREEHARLLEELARFVPEASVEP